MLERPLRWIGIATFGLLLSAPVSPRAEEMPVERVEEICGRLVEMGCDAVALSDTDGLATPRDIERLVGHLAGGMGLAAIGVHLHDRRGLGVTNAYAAYQAGVRIFDASIGEASSVGDWTIWRAILRLCRSSPN